MLPDGLKMSEYKAHWLKVFRLIMVISLSLSKKKKQINNCKEKLVIL